MQNQFKIMETLDENVCYSRNIQYSHSSNWKRIGSTSKRTFYLTRPKHFWMPLGLHAGVSRNSYTVFRMGVSESEASQTWIQPLPNAGRLHASLYKKMVQTLLTKCMLVFLKGKPPKCKKFELPPW